TDLAIFFHVTFFFQAEDGIRDFHVTGVQTCALPISSLPARILLKGILAGSEAVVLIEYNESNAKFTFEDTTLICRLIDGKYPNRSEERRVGKECTYRTTTYQAQAIIIRIQRSLNSGI